jgi:uncharacterized membrane protein YgdD (TMEM256/DUF423 family)
MGRPACVAIGACLMQRPVGGFQKIIGWIALRLAVSQPYSLRTGAGWVPC